MALAQARGDDADHARVPSLRSEHVRRALALLRELCLGLEEDAPLKLATLAVCPVELDGDLARALRALGEDELEPGVCAAKATGGVQPRGQREAQRALADGARAHAGDRHERPQPGLARRGEGSQPAAHERAVLAHEGHHVGDRRQTDEVEVLAQLVRLAARREEQGLRELVRHAGAAQLGARISAHRGVDDRGVRKPAVRPRVMVVSGRATNARKRLLSAR